MKRRKLMSLLIALCLCMVIFPLTSHATGSTIAEESAEYEALEVFLATYAWWGADYDAQAETGISLNGHNVLQAMLSEGYCYTDSIYPGPVRETVWNFDGKSPDPLGKYDSYAKVSVAKIDWVLENIFNCSASHIASMKATLDDDFYILDGFYYIRIGGIGGGFDVDIQDITLSGQRYYVTYNSKSIYYDEYCTRYYAIFELKNIDSQNYWSLYYNKKLANGEKPDIPTSTSPAPVSTGNFADVAQNDYYYNAVRWGVERGIVSGTSANTFSPNEICTKAQILTFLWRANGSPEPTRSNPFNDILEGRYYYKAAVWAYENRIASGRSFGPDEPCTRAMTVTYLWMLAGSPVVTGDTFSDVPFTADCVRAVLWAVSEGITGGTGKTTFSPDSICTRAQIITFIYRNEGYDRVATPNLAPSITDVYSSWSEAYRDFVMNQKFLTAAYDYSSSDAPVHPWGTEGAQSATLYDMDVDGVPELFIHNGHEDRYSSMYYVYTFANEQIVYIGRIMQLSYKPNSQFTGIWSYWTAWGTAPDYYSYFWKEGTKLHSESVYSQEFDSTYKKPETDNTELYNEFAATDFFTLPHLSSIQVRDIQNMGWDAFVAQKQSRRIAKKY